MKAVVVPDARDTVKVCLSGSGPMLLLEMHLGPLAVYATREQAEALRDGLVSSIARVERIEAERGMQPLPLEAVA
jgi:hypothetical protein